MEDGYCVKWEKHHNAIVSVFDHLYKHNVLVDCTLAAENKYIKAHRIVLMACSPYFEDILSQHSDNYPIVWMNMRFSELQALIDFCYRGEVRLPQEELPGFLNAARLLHIKGLCDSSDTYRKRRYTDNSSIGSAKKKHRTSSPSGSLVKQVSVCVGDGDVKSGDNKDDGEYDDMEDDHHHIVQTNGDTTHTQGEDSDRSDLDTDEESSAGDGEEKESIMLDDLIRGSGVSQFLYRWTCSKCGEAFPTRATYHDHKKGCTADPGVDHPWRCHKCPNTYKNKKDLVRHLLYCGNETERHVCDRCGNTYKYERGLRRHKIYCGTNVQPMVCDACGKTYKYKRGLRRHQKQQCGLINAYLESKGVSKAKIPEATPEINASSSKAVSTSKQQVTSVSKVEPEDEIESPQIKVTPDVCKICGKVYKYRKAFLNHINNCVTNEDTQNQEDEEEEGDNVETKVTNVKVDVHAAQPEDDDDQETIENIMEEIKATEKELNSEELERQTKSSDKSESQVNSTKSVLVKGEADLSGETSNT